MFLTVPSRTVPFSIFSSVFSLMRTRSDSSRALRERTILERRLLYFKILNSWVVPIRASKSLTGFKSIWEPGKNACKPRSTDIPPFTREVILPSTVPPFSYISLISSQILILVAFSFDRMMSPSSSSRLSRRTSTLSPTFAVMFPSGSINSRIWICPSDLYPISTRTNSLSTWTISPLTSSPS